MYVCVCAIARYTLTSFKTIDSINYNVHLDTSDYKGRWLLKVYWGIKLTFCLW